jgi:post-segregation antitoxin (ccd killing protein)
MATVTLTLPEELAETARQMGLLEDATLTELLEREIQRRRKSALADEICASRDEAD